MKPTRPQRPPKVSVHTSRGRSKPAKASPALAPERKTKVRRETAPVADGGSES